MLNFRDIIRKDVITSWRNIILLILTKLAKVPLILGESSFTKETYISLKE
jgi:hypothetical protein